MKKIIAFVLTLILVLSLVACGGKGKTESNNSNINPIDNTNNTSADSGNNDSTPDGSDIGNNSSSDLQAKAMTDSIIYLDLEEVNSNVPPQLVEGTIIVPVQAIMEKIGYDVNWIPAELKLEVWEPSRQHPTIILTVGNITAYYEKYAEEIDERVSYEEPLATAPVVIDGTLFAPLNFVAQAVGYTIDGNVDSEHIYLFSPEYMENQIGEGIGEDQPSNKADEGAGESQPANKADETGEGIGQTQPLAEDEKSYVLSIRTESWLDLKDEQKYEVLFLMARWWDIVDGYIVEDYDSVLADLDHQMETYFRNGVDEGLLRTACDIYGLDASKYVQ